MERLAFCDSQGRRIAPTMKGILKHHKEVDRKLWIDFLMQSPQGAVYAHPAYLDVVAPGWQAIEVWQDQTLLAIMPLYIKSKGGMEYALQPSFCQYWGIFFAPGGEVGNYKHFSLRRKIVKAVLEVIPKSIRWFLFGFAPEFDYPHPFHWEGYELKTRFTYRLDLSLGNAALEKAFGSDTRYDIRKAAGLGLLVKSSLDGSQLEKLILANHASGKHLLKPAELVVLRTLIPVLVEQHLGFLLEVQDGQGQTVAAALFGSFAGKTAYLMSAQSPTGSSQGAMTLLLDKAIKKSAESDQVFDFEGSMIEGIEGFFRGFGGVPVPYLTIEKNQLPLFVRWIRKLR
jgi:hypothetical protein